MFLSCAAALAPGRSFNFVASESNARGRAWKKREGWLVYGWEGLKGNDERSGLEEEGTWWWRVVWVGGRRPWN